MWRTVVSLALATAACGNALPAIDDGTSSAGTTATSPGMSSGSDAGAGSVDGGTASADATPAEIGPGDHVVFVTSDAYDVEGVHSVEDADKKCNELATKSEDAVLTSRQFVAWLSDDHVAAKDRISSRPGPWVRPDGVRVANDRAQLLGGPDPLAAAIEVDEKKKTRDGQVWTGTWADGSASHATCENWSTTSVTAQAVVGEIAAVKPDWTAWIVDTCAGTASLTRRLYCFETDPAAPKPPP